MAKRGLKNLVREKDVRNGLPTWRLKTLDGTPVEAFSAFCEHNVDYAFSTQKRYAETVSRFIDYLFEADVFGRSTSAKHINAVIDAYPILLRDGSDVTALRIEQNDFKSDSDQWLVGVARELDWEPLRPNSFANTLAAVNRFLKLSESLAREASEKASLLGVKLEIGEVPLIKALDGLVTLSRHEILAIKQNSMLGNVVKFAPKGIQRAKRLRGPASPGQIDRKVLDFPLSEFPKLVGAANSWRDRALWLLLAASGIRTSEAKNLLLEDVDLVNQQVYVFDPSGRRSLLGLNHPVQHRFKGREMAMTYLFSPLKADFFYALEQYLRIEYVPCYKQGEPQYLFQYIEPTRRGEPLVNASDAALAQSFKKALKLANVAITHGEADWTLHSLRHLYGVYMLNDYPVDLAAGEFGLQLVEVQMLMGHKSIRSTAHYARSKHRRLVAKLEASDRNVLGLESNNTVRLLGSESHRTGGKND